MHDNAEKDTQDIYIFYIHCTVVVLDVNFTVKLFKNKK